jgi:hypothetical protein
MSSSELAQEALDNPTSRMLKVLAAAEEEGWTVGRISLAVRLSGPDDKPDRIGEVALPFYAIWELTGWTPKGRPSWHFLNARAKNGQPLSEGDILTYLEDPSVIYPEPPAPDVPAESGEPCYCDYYSFKPHTHPETTGEVDDPRV